jgi:hypothetical protein
MGLRCHRPRSLVVLHLPTLATPRWPSRTIDLRNHLVFAVRALRRHLGYPYKLQHHWLHIRLQ